MFTTSQLNFLSYMHYTVSKDAKSATKASISDVDGDSIAYMAQSIVLNHDGGLFETLIADEYGDVVSTVTRWSRFSEWQDNVLYQDAMDDRADAERGVA